MSFGRVIMPARHTHGGGFKPLPTAPPLTALIFQDLPLGGVGYVRGLDMNPNGTMYNYGDVYGGYSGNTTVGTTWSQLITAASMPANVVGSVGNCQGGIIAIASAPSNSLIVYMYWDPSQGHGPTCPFYSTNGGVSWTQGSGLSTIDSSNQSAASLTANRLTVDPNNSSVVYLGTYNQGLWRTLNGGVTWSQVSTSSIPFAINSASINAFGSGYSASATGTMTWAGAGCTVNPVLNVKTSSTGDFNPINGAAVLSIATAGLCQTIPPSSATTWTPSGIGAGTGASFFLHPDPGVAAIAFDKTSGTTTLSGVTVTARVIVSVIGAGIYTTNDGGTTWSLIASSPTNIGRGKTGSDGTYYSSDTTQSHVYRISTGNVVTDISSANTNGLAGIVIDPFNPARVLEPEGGGNIHVPTTAVNTGTPSWTAGTPGLSVAVGDTPWMNATGQFSLSFGDMFFDPFSTTSSTSVTIAGSGTVGPFIVSSGLNIVTGDLLRITNTGTPGNYMLGKAIYAGGFLAITILGSAPGGYLGAVSGGSGTFSAWTITKERLWLAWGSGMMYSDGVYATSGQVWIPQTQGIELADAMGASWNASTLVLSTADRPWWRITNPNSSPPNYQPQAQWPQVTQTNYIAAAAGGSGFVAGSTNQGGFGNYGFSTDGGSTFSAWAGGVAAWAGGPLQFENSSDGFGAPLGGALNYTNDGGATFHPSGGSIPASGWVNPSPTIPAQGPFCIDVADSPVAYYAFNQNGSVYKSTDHGQNFAVTAGTTGAPTNPYAGFTPQLKSVPGQAKNLFFAGGDTMAAAINFTSFTTMAASVPTGNSFIRSVDGANTWVAVSGVQDVFTFALGAPKPGNTYPTVYIVGWVSVLGVPTFGIWESDNFTTTPGGETWTQLATFPSRAPFTSAGWLDTPWTMAADPVNYRRLVIGYQGSGFVYFAPASAPTFGAAFSGHLALNDATGPQTTAALGNPAGDCIVFIHDAHAPEDFTGYDTITFGGQPCRLIQYVQSVHATINQGSIRGVTIYYAQNVPANSTMTLDLQRTWTPYGCDVSVFNETGTHFEEVTICGVGVTGANWASAYLPGSNYWINDDPTNIWVAGFPPAEGPDPQIVNAVIPTNYVGVAFIFGASSGGNDSNPTTWAAPFTRQAAAEQHYIGSHAELQAALATCITSGNVIASATGGPVSWSAREYGMIVPVIGGTGSSPPAKATVTLTSSPNPSVHGTPVLYTATVTGSGPTPTGTVTFADAQQITPVSLGTVALSSGIATLTDSSLSGTATGQAAASGRHNIMAWYSGDKNYGLATALNLQTVT